MGNRGGEEGREEEYVTMRTERKEKVGTRDRTRARKQEEQEEGREEGRHGYL